MGVFDLEGTTLQGRDFRDHLNKNWTSGNRALANLNSLYGANTAGKATFTPSGTLSTLAELNTQYPDGEVGIFVTADTGHWYYWSGSNWTDGGDYQAALLDFEDLTVKMSGLNILKGTSGIKRTLSLSDQYHSQSKATNGEHLSVIANNFYNYSAKIFNVASADASVLVNINDKNGNVVKRLTGTHVAAGQTGTSYVAFKISEGQTISVYPIAYSSSQTISNVGYAEEMLTKGTTVKTYHQNLSEMPAGDAISFIFNQTLNREKLDSIKFSGVNLLLGTTDEVQTSSVNGAHSLGFWTDNGENFPVKYGDDYIYHIKITNPSVDALAKVQKVSSDGNVLATLNGSVVKAGSTGYSTVKLHVDSNTTFLNLIGCNTWKGTVLTATWSEEMLEYGSVQHDWNPAISEMSIADALILINSLLHDRTPIDSLKIPGINLLTGTSSDDQSVALNAYHLSNQATNGKNFIAKAGEKYIYHAKINNTSSSQAYALVTIMDSNGNTISRINGSKVAANSTGISSVVIEPESDEALYLAPVAYSTSQKLTATWSKEMLEYGETIHKWTKAFSEMTLVEALLAVSLIENSAEVTDDSNSSPDVGSTAGMAILKVSGDLTGLGSADSKAVLGFELLDNNRTLKGYAEMQWQGNSSLSLPKKGFKFKTYKDSAESKKLKWRPLPTMYKSNSWHLKAYYTDKYNVNDGVCAEILSKIVASNSNAPSNLLLANHFGTIQSMPVLLYFNDQFYGLMEFCTKSGSDLWNLDESDANQIAIEGNGGTGSKWTKNTVTVADDGDFSLESDNGTNASTAANTLADFIANSSDADFKANLSSHIEINSIADYIIFNYLILNSDAWSAKNHCYVTYDGSLWYMMSYDFDSTLLSSWKIGSTYNPDREFFSDGSISNNLLNRFIKLFPDKLLARFNELDSLRVIDPLEMINIFDSAVKNVGEGALQMEWAAWPDNAAYQVDTNIDNINKMFISRKSLLKSKLNAMQ